MNFSKLQLKFTWLLAGIGVAFLLYFFNPFSIDESANKILAVAGVMIVWWVSEALPLPVVALVPIVLFPLLRIADLKATTAPYANPAIFLFMGGFMLGLAIEKWNLHRRIALNIVRLTGTSGDRIVLGFILATGLLSMWLSNTATTMMMFPIAASVIHVMTDNHRGQGNLSNFSVAIMLAIAYAANIGGIATVIGTPPNVAYIGQIKEKFGYSIGFLGWMLLCLPLAALLLFCLYWIMVKWLYPARIKSDHATRELIKQEIHSLGPLGIPEKRVLIVFICTALLWITREEVLNKRLLPWLEEVTRSGLFSFRLDDTIIAIMCAIALFICPSGKKGEEEGSLLEWGDTQKMAWGILLLFGGGISLANQLEEAGLIKQLGEWLAQFSGNGFLLVLGITIISIFISELVSNVAQVIVFGPVVSSLAVSLGMDPLMLGIPMTLAASCAGMLPMGTPPNAIVFASGHIRLRQMVKTGFIMNLVAVALITLFCWFLLPVLMRVVGH